MTEPYRIKPTPLQFDSFSDWITNNGKSREEATSYREYGDYLRKATLQHGSYDWRAEQNIREVEQAGLAKSGLIDPQEEPDAFLRALSPPESTLDDQANLLKKHLKFGDPDFALLNEYEAGKLAYQAPGEGRVSDFSDRDAYRFPGEEQDTDLLNRTTSAGIEAMNMIPRRYGEVMRSLVDRGELPMAKIPVLDETGKPTGKFELRLGKGVEGLPLPDAIEKSRGAGVNYDDALEAQVLLSKAPGTEEPYWRNLRLRELTTLIHGLAENDPEAGAAIDGVSRKFAKGELDGWWEKSKDFMTGGTEAILETIGGWIPGELGESITENKGLRELGDRFASEDPAMAAEYLKRKLVDSGVLDPGEEFSSEDFSKALAQAAQERGMASGVFDFHAGEGEEWRNVKSYGFDIPQMHPAALVQPELFERTLAAAPISDEAKEMIRNQRELTLTDRFSYYNDLLNKSDYADEWQLARAEGKAQGLKDSQILQEFVSDPEVYSRWGEWAYGAARSIPMSIWQAMLTPFALAGGKFEQQELVAMAEKDALRAEVAQVFGKPFGALEDVTNTIAPMVVDLAASAALTAVTSPAGAGAYLTARGTAGLTVKGAAKALTSAAFRASATESLEDAAARLVRHKLVTATASQAGKRGTSAATNAMAAIRAYNGTTAQKIGALPAIFLPAANRSAGATYGAVYNALSKDPTLTPEQVQDRALGAAFTSGAITGIITSAFSAIGHGGLEDAVLRGATRKQLKEGLQTFAGNKIGNEAFDDALSKALSMGFKRLGAKQAFKSVLGQGLEEGFEEATDEFINGFVQDLALEENTPIMDRLHQSFMAFAIGAGMGMATPVFHDGINRLRRRGKPDPFAIEAQRNRLINDITDQLRQKDSPITANFVGMFLNLSQRQREFITSAAALRQAQNQRAAAGQRIQPGTLNQTPPPLDVPPPLPVDDTRNMQDLDFSPRSDEENDLDERVSEALRHLSDDREDMRISQRLREDADQVGTLLPGETRHLFDDEDETKLKGGVTREAYEAGVEGAAWDSLEFLHNGLARFVENTSPTGTVPRTEEELSDPRVRRHDEGRSLVAENKALIERITEEVQAIKKDKGKTGLPKQIKELEAQIKKLDGKIEEVLRDQTKGSENRNNEISGEDGLHAQRAKLIEQLDVARHDLGTADQRIKAAEEEIKRLKPLVEDDAIAIAHAREQEILALDPEQLERLVKVLEVTERASGRVQRVRRLLQDFRDALWADRLNPPPMSGETKPAKAPKNEAVQLARQLHAALGSLMAAHNREAFPFDEGMFSESGLLALRDAVADGSATREEKAKFLLAYYARRFDVSREILGTGVAPTVTEPIATQTPDGRTIIQRTADGAVAQRVVFAPTKESHQQRLLNGEVRIPQEGIEAYELHATQLELLFKDSIGGDEDAVSIMHHLLFPKRTGYSFTRLRAAEYVLRVLNPEAYRVYRQKASTAGETYKVLQLFGRVDSETLAEYTSARVFGEEFSLTSRGNPRLIARDWTLPMSETLDGLGGEFARIRAARQKLRADVRWARGKERDRRQQAQFAKEARARRGEAGEGIVPALPQRKDRKTPQSRSALRETQRAKEILATEKDARLQLRREELRWAKRVIEQARAASRRIEEGKEVSVDDAITMVAMLKDAQEIRQLELTRITKEREKSFPKHRRDFVAPSPDPRESQLPIPLLPEAQLAADPDFKEFEEIDAGAENVVFPEELLRLAAEASPLELVTLMTRVAQAGVPFRFSGVEPKDAAFGLPRLLKGLSRRKTKRSGERTLIDESAQHVYLSFKDIEGANADAAQIIRRMIKDPGTATEGVDSEALKKALSEAASDQMIKHPNHYVGQPAKKYRLLVGENIYRVEWPASNAFPQFIKLEGDEVKNAKEDQAKLANPSPQVRPVSISTANTFDALSDELAREIYRVFPVVDLAPFQEELSLEFDGQLHKWESNSKHTYFHPLLNKKVSKVPVEGWVIKDKEGRIVAGVNNNDPLFIEEFHRNFPELPIFDPFGVIAPPVEVPRTPPSPKTFRPKSTLHEVYGTGAATAKEGEFDDLHLRKLVTDLGARVTRTKVWKAGTWKVTTGRVKLPTGGPKKTQFAKGIYDRLRVLTVQALDLLTDPVLGVDRKDKEQAMIAEIKSIATALGGEGADLSGLPATLGADLLKVSEGSTPTWGFLGALQKNKIDMRIVRGGNKGRPNELLGTLLPVPVTEQTTRRKAAPYLSMERTQRNPAIKLDFTRIRLAEEGRASERLGRVIDLHKPTGVDGEGRVTRVSGFYPRDLQPAFTAEPVTPEDDSSPIVVGSLSEVGNKAHGYHTRTEVARKRITLPNTNAPQFQIVKEDGTPKPKKDRIYATISFRVLNTDPSTIDLRRPETWETAEQRADRYDPTASTKRKKGQAPLPLGMNPAQVEVVTLMHRATDFLDFLYGKESSSNTFAQFYEEFENIDSMFDALIKDIGVIPEGAKKDLTKAEKDLLELNAKISSSRERMTRALADYDNALALRDSAADIIETFAQFKKELNRKLEILNDPLVRKLQEGRDEISRTEALIRGVNKQIDQVLRSKPDDVARNLTQERANLAALEKEKFGTLRRISDFLFGGQGARTKLFGESLTFEQKFQLVTKVHADYVEAVYLHSLVQRIWRNTGVFVISETKQVTPSGGKPGTARRWFSTRRKEESAIAQIVDLLNDPADIPGFSYKPLGDGGEAARAVQSKRNMERLSYGERVNLGAVRISSGDPEFKINRLSSHIRENLMSPKDAAAVEQWAAERGGKGITDRDIVAWFVDTQMLNSPIIGAADERGEPTFPSLKRVRDAAVSRARNWRDKAVKDYRERNNLTDLDDADIMRVMAVNALDIDAFDQTNKLAEEEAPTQSMELMQEGGEQVLFSLQDLPDVGVQEVDSGAQAVLSERTEAAAQSLVEVPDPIHEAVPATYDSHRLLMGLMERLVGEPTAAFFEQVASDPSSPASRVLRMVQEEVAQTMQALSNTPLFEDRIAQMFEDIEDPYDLQRNEVARSFLNLLAEYANLFPEAQSQRIKEEYGAPNEELPRDEAVARLTKTIVHVINLYGRTARAGTPLARWQQQTKFFEAAQNLRAPWLGFMITNGMFTPRLAQAILKGGNSPRDLNVIPDVREEFQLQFQEAWALLSNQYPETFGNVEEDDDNLRGDTKVRIYLGALARSHGLYSLARPNPTESTDFLQSNQQQYDALFPDGENSSVEGALATILRGDHPDLPLDPQAQVVAELLLQDPGFLSRVQTVMVDEGDAPNVAGKATFPGGVPQVTLYANGNSGKNLPRVLLEELVHLRLADTLTADPSELTPEQRMSRARLEGLRLKVIAEARTQGDDFLADRLEGAAGLHEFASAFLLDEQVQNLVRRASRPRTEKKSLFRRIIDAITGLFRKPAAQADEYSVALEGLIDLTRRPFGLRSTNGPPLAEVRAEQAANVIFQQAASAARTREGLGLGEDRPTLPEVEEVELPSETATIGFLPALDRAKKQAAKPYSREEERAITHVKDTVEKLIPPGVRLVYDEHSPRAFAAIDGFVILNMHRLRDTGLLELDPDARETMVDFILDEEVIHVTVERALPTETLDRLAASMTGEQISATLQTMYDTPEERAAARARFNEKAPLVATPTKGRTPRQSEAQGRISRAADDWDAANKGVPLTLPVAAPDNERLASVVATIGNGHVAIAPVPVAGNLADTLTNLFIHSTKVAEKDARGKVVKKARVKEAPATFTIPEPGTPEAAEALGSSPFVLMTRAGATVETEEGKSTEVGAVLVDDQFAFLIPDISEILGGTVIVAPKSDAETVTGLMFEERVVPPLPVAEPVEPGEPTPESREERRRVVHEWLADLHSRIRRGRSAEDAAVDHGLIRGNPDKSVKTLVGRVHAAVLRKQANILRKKEAQSLVRSNGLLRSAMEQLGREYRALQNGYRAGLPRLPYNLDALFDEGANEQEVLAAIRALTNNDTLQMVDIAGIGSDTLEAFYSSLAASGEAGRRILKSLSVDPGDEGDDDTPLPPLDPAAVGETLADMDGAVVEPTPEGFRVAVDRGGGAPVVVEVDIEPDGTASVAPTGDSTIGTEVVVNLIANAVDTGVTKVVTNDNPKGLEQAGFAKVDVVTPGGKQGTPTYETVMGDPGFAETLFDPKERAALAAELGHVEWTTRAWASFTLAFDAFVKTGRAATKALLNAFEKVLRALKITSLAAVSLISPDHSNSVYAPPVTVEQVRTFTPAPVDTAALFAGEVAPGGQLALAPQGGTLAPAPERGVAPLRVGSTQTQAETIAQPAPEKPALRASVDWGDESPSQDSRDIAEWVMRTDDTLGSPFIIADKPEGKLHAFDKHGKLVYSGPALFGMDKGDVRTSNDDSPGTRITPSGRFTALYENSPVPDSHGFAYRKNVVLTETKSGGSAVAVHRLYTVHPEQRRKARLDSPTAEDNRISLGCINIGDEAIEKIIAPMFKDHAWGAVYVVPETLGGRLNFPAPLSFDTSLGSESRKKLEKFLRGVDGDTHNQVIAAFNEFHEARRNPGADLAALRNQVDAALKKSGFNGYSGMLFNSIGSGTTLHGNPFSEYIDRFSYTVYEKGDYKHPNRLVRTVAGDLDRRVRHLLDERNQLTRAAEVIIKTYQKRIDAAMKKAGWKLGDPEFDAVAKLVNKAVGSTSIRGNRTTLPEGVIEDLEDRLTASLEAIHNDPDLAGARNWTSKKAAVLAAYETHNENLEEAHAEALAHAKAERNTAMQRLALINPDLAQEILDIRKNLIDPLSERVEELYGLDTKFETDDTDLRLYVTRQYRIFLEPGYVQDQWKRYQDKDPEFMTQFETAARWFDKQHRDSQIQRFMRGDYTEDKIKSKNFGGIDRAGREIVPKMMSRAQAEEKADIAIAVAEEARGGVSFGQAAVHSFLMKHFGVAQHKMLMGPSLSTRDKQSLKVLLNNMKELNTSLPGPLRELMGEYGEEEGAGLALRTLSTVATMAAQQQTLFNLRDFGKENGFIKTYKEVTEARKLNPGAYSDWDLISTDTSTFGTQFDPLKWHFAPKEMVEGIKRAYSNQGSAVAQETAEQAISGIMRFARAATGRAMQAKTLGSLGFYTRQAISNVIAGAANGAPLAALRYDVFWRIAKLQSTAEFDQTVIKLVSLGILEADLTTEYIRELTKGVRSGKEMWARLLDAAFPKDGTTKSVVDTVGRKAGAVLGGIEHGATRAVAAIDGLYKWGLFETELETLRAAKAEGTGGYAGYTDAQLEKMAADIVLDTTQSHNRTPALVKHWTRSPLGLMYGTFLRFKAEVPRIVGNSWQRAWKEWRSDNPVIKARGAKRFAGLVAVLPVLSAAIPLAIKAAAGVGDDEEEALRKSGPDYYKYATLLYFRGEDGSLTSVNITFLNFFSPVVDPFLRAFEYMRKGDIGGASKALFMTIVADQYLDTQILAQAALDVRANRNSTTGDPIWDERLDGWGETMVKWVEYIGNEAFMPRILTDLNKAVEAAKSDYTSWERSPLGIIVAGAKPWRQHKVDLGLNFRRYLADLEPTHRAIVRPKYRLLSDKGVSPDEIRELYHTEVADRKTVNEEIYRVMRGFRSLGMKDRDLRNIMIYKAGIGKRRADLLFHGLMERVIPDKEFVEQLQTRYPERYRLYSSQWRNYPRLIQLEP